MIFSLIRLYLNIEKKTLLWDIIGLLNWLLEVSGIDMSPSPGTRNAEPKKTNLVVLANTEVLRHNCLK